MRILFLVRLKIHTVLGVVRVDGEGVDARLMRDTWAAWGDPDATAVSHVGWGLNPAARWDALTMMDRRETTNPKSHQEQRQCRLY